MKPFRRSVTLFFLLFCGSLGCKSPVKKEEQGSTLKSSESVGPLCCRYEKQGKGFFYETVQCKSDTPAGRSECCETWKTKLPFSNLTPNGSMIGNCDTPGRQYVTNVNICRGPTRFGEESKVVGGASDAVSSLSQLAHVWIKTSSYEAGMGPKIWTKNQGDASALEKLTDFLSARAIREKVQVAWRDHSGLSDNPRATCTSLYFCDESCVDRVISSGVDLGVYTIANQCHVAAVSVLRQCGCHNHCLKWLPGTNTCIDRVFPELRGFNLHDDT